jgi:hypothetical protein
MVDENQSFTRFDAATWILSVMGMLRQLTAGPTITRTRCEPQTRPSPTPTIQSEPDNRVSIPPCKGDPGELSYPVLAPAFGPLYLSDQEAKMPKLTILASLVLFLTACGGGNMTNMTTPPPNAQMAGAWDIQSSSTIFTEVTSTDLFVTQSGSTLTSPNVNNVVDCGSGGTMSGTVKGNNVTMTLTSTAIFPAPPDTITLTGGFSSGTITGNYTTSGFNCTRIGGVNDQGTFSAKLIPPIASTSWTGTTTSTSGGPSLKFSANLTEDNAGNVSGSMTFTGSACISTTNVTGPQMGNRITLTSDALVLRSGISSDAKSITGLYNLGQACSFDSGTFSMTRP